MNLILIFSYVLMTYVKLNTFYIYLFLKFFLFFKHLIYALNIFCVNEYVVIFFIRSRNKNSNVII